MTLYLHESKKLPSPDQWDQSEIQRRRRSVSGHFPSLFVGSSLNSVPSVQVDMVDCASNIHASGATEGQEPRHSQQVSLWVVLIFFPTSHYVLPQMKLKFEHS